MINYLIILTIVLFFFCNLGLGHYSRLETIALDLQTVTWISLTLNMFFFNMFNLPTPNYVFGLRWSRPKPLVCYLKNNLNNFKNM